MGCLVVITGPMFSGKSKKLIKIIRRAKFAQKKILVIKPGLDSRQTTIRARKLKESQSVIAAEYPAWTVNNILEFGQLIDKYSPEILILDEAQFFGRWIAEAINRLLLDSECLIYVAGLDQTAWGEAFSPMGELMALANKVIKLTAVCFQCGKEANRTHKSSAGMGTIEIGDIDKYEARCNNCFQTPN